MPDLSEQSLLNDLEPAPGSMQLRSLWHGWQGLDAEYRSLMGELAALQPANGRHAGAEHSAQVTACPEAVYTHTLSECNNNIQLMLAPWHFRANIIPRPSISLQRAQGRMHVMLAHTCRWVQAGAAAASSSEASGLEPEDSGESEDADEAWDPQHATPHGKGRKQSSRSASERRSLSAAAAVSAAAACSLGCL